MSRCRILILHYTTHPLLHVRSYQAFVIALLCQLLFVSITSDVLSPHHADEHKYTSLNRLRIIIQVRENDAFS